MEDWYLTILIHSQNFFFNLSNYIWRQAAGWALFFEFVQVVKSRYIVLQAECFWEYLLMNIFRVVEFFDFYQCLLRFCSSFFLQNQVTIRWSDILCVRRQTAFHPTCIPFSNKTKSCGKVRVPYQSLQEIFVINIHAFSLRQLVEFSHSYTSKIILSIVKFVLSDNLRTWKLQVLSIIPRFWKYLIIWFRSARVFLSTFGGKFLPLQKQ